ncbi:MAG: malto-oligosyltrehalose synthase, partial [Desulforhopalus sp.]
KISTMPTERCKGERMPLYIVAEKILADFEHLPGDWPLHGTTGYDFSNMLNGLLLDSAAEKEFTTLYHRFVGSRYDFEELVYGGKKLIIDSAMAGELTVLVTLLFRLARSCRVSRDFTLNRLRQALIEIVACFPVYRTYMDGENPREEDVRVIEWAVTRAKTRQQPYDLGIFDFIKSVLLLEPSPCDEDTQKRLDFVLKFQQYTGPVMAKGLEDTAFYIYNRLLSLNEVGGEPKRFGISPAAFHRTNQDRMQHWPHAMLNTSTHDSKRSEDVRARINVLTEMVPAWRQQVFRWRNLNRRLRTGLDGKTAPGRNDEYAFYQNLLGAWPVEALDVEGHDLVIKRIKDAMLKACREAKIHTSWISANESYEKAMNDFVEKSLSTGDNPFLEEFLRFQKEVAWFGMLNSLSQVFLKLVSPGIPDIYQGNELWRFCLVDPDNRRPVDYSKRQAMLSTMLERIKGQPSAREKYLQELLDNLADGRAKMFIINGALRLRNSCPEVFARGSYTPLEVKGRKSRHLCAFARQNANRVVVAAAPRLYFTLMHGARELPVGARVWEDTEICFPGGRKWPSSFENIYSSTTEKSEDANGESLVLRAASLLRSWPVALLQGTVA